MTSYVKIYNICLDISTQYEEMKACSNLLGPIKAYAILKTCRQTSRNREPLNDSRFWHSTTWEIINSIMGCCQKIFLDESVGLDFFRMRWFLEVASIAITYWKMIHLIFGLLWFEFFRIYNPYKCIYYNVHIQIQNRELFLKRSD